MTHKGSYYDFVIRVKGKSVKFRRCPATVNGSLPYNPLLQSNGKEGTAMNISQETCLYVFE